MYVNKKVRKKEKKNSSALKNFVKNYKNARVFYIKINGFCETKTASWSKKRNAKEGE